MTLLLELCIGTLTKEVQQARQQALVYAVHAGYRNLNWRLYTDKQNIIELWGEQVDRPNEAHQIAEIKIDQQTVSLSYDRSVEDKVKAP